MLWRIKAVRIQEFFPPVSRGVQLTDKGQQIDRFLQFSSQTDKKTDSLSTIKKPMKKQVWENE